MRKLFIFSLGACALIATSCSRSNNRNELVKETYIHKYGVPLSKKDWSNQGKEGQVIKILKNGVTVTQDYEEGKLNGKTTYTFPHSSTIQHVEIYDQGILTADIQHYPSGVPMKEDRFANGQLSQITCWFEDGSPSLLETYQDGLLMNGEYRSHLNSIESRVQDGQGVRIARSLEGHLTNKDIIQDGQMIERVTYFTSGEPSVITNYENGLIHGQRMTFLPGGLPDSLEQWVHGKREGITVTYQNGEKIAETPYHNDRKHGIEKLFRDGSIVVEEISWNNNVRHGPSVLLVDGQAKTDWYHHGALVSRITYERMNERMSIR